MAKTTSVKTTQEEEEQVPDVVPASKAQVVPVGSMDRDPATGQPIRVGVPENSDEDEVGAFLVWLQEEADEANADSMAILAEQLRRANSAESIREALAEKHTINGKDFIAVPFLATGFTIREGKFEDEELPFYASIDAINPDNPDGFVVNCGGNKVLVHLKTLKRFDAFPIPMCITGKPTRKGRTVLSLEILEQTKA